MSASLYNCSNCGASLSLEQLRGTDCPYCKKAFPHHARAVEHAALVNQVMAQQIQHANQYMQPPQVPGAYGANMPQQPQNYGYGYGYNAAQVNRAVKSSMMIFVVIGAISFLAILGATVAVFVFVGR